MNYLDGYLLFPPTYTYADLVQVVLQAMELKPSEVEVSLPREGYAIPLRNGACKTIPLVCKKTCR